MTNKIKFLPILLIITLALLSSCGAGTTDRLTAAEVESIEDYVMSSYFMLRGDEALPESRAAWPAHSIELQFPAAGGTTTQSKQGFPEKGQRTTVTITESGTTDIYFVENVTTYPRREDVLAQTTESYYVKNLTAGDDGPLDFNSNDPLWDIDGDADDFNKRVQFETEYQDGTVRYETVEATTTEDSVQYAAFNINGALTFPEGDSWSPPVDTANYSSMVS